MLRLGKTAAAVVEQESSTDVNDAKDATRTAKAAGNWGKFDVERAAFSAPSNFNAQMVLAAQVRALASQRMQQEDIIADSDDDDDDNDEEEDEEDETEN